MLLSRCERLVPLPGLYQRQQPQLGMLAAKALLNLEGPFSIEAAIKKIREWKAQEVGERKAAEEIKRAANREKRKIDDLAAKHSANKIKDDTHKKAIANSPAKRLVQRRCCFCTTPTRAATTPVPQSWPSPRMAFTSFFRSAKTARRSMNRPSRTYHKSAPTIEC